MSLIIRSLDKLDHLDHLEQIFQKFEISKIGYTSILDRYIIFVSNCKSMAQILRKLQLPQTCFEKFKIP